MKRALLPCLLALASVGAPAIAQSQTTTYTAVGVNMYAGPDYSYPRIESVPGGVRVAVYGCLSGGNWCDVATGGARGWVTGSALRLRRGNQVVYVSDQPSWVPLTVFALGAYWGSHYQNRPWYHDQYRYQGHRSEHYSPRHPPIRYEPRRGDEHGHDGYPDHRSGSDGHHGQGSNHGHGSDHPYPAHGHMNQGGVHPTPHAPVSSDHRGAQHRGKSDHHGSDHHPR